MSAADKRKSDSDSVVKAFMETIPQVPDPVLTLLRFEAFVEGWQSTLKFDRDRDETESDDPDPDQVS